VVDAPRTGASKCQIEEGKTVKHLRFATSEQREEAARDAHHKIGYRHFTGQDEGGWPGEQADQKQQTADKFDDAGHPDQRERLQIVESGDVREGKELRQWVLEIEQRHHNAKHAEHARRPNRSNFREIDHRSLPPSKNVRPSRGPPL
jgi:hypothetical protein